MPFSGVNGTGTGFADARTGPQDLRIARLAVAQRRGTRQYYYVDDSSSLSGEARSKAKRCLGLIDARAEPPGILPLRQ